MLSPSKAASTSGFTSDCTSTASQYLVRWSNWPRQSQLHWAWQPPDEDTQAGFRPCHWWSLPNFKINVELSKPWMCINDDFGWRFTKRGSHCALSTYAEAASSNRCTVKFLHVITFLERHLWNRTSYRIWNQNAEWANRSQQIASWSKENDRCRQGQEAQESLQQPDACASGLFCPSQQTQDGYEIED